MIDEISNIYEFLIYLLINVFIAAIIFFILNFIIPTPEERASRNTKHLIACMQEMKKNNLSTDKCNIIVNSR